MLGSERTQLVSAQPDTAGVRSQIINYLKIRYLILLPFSSKGLRPASATLGTPNDSKMLPQAEKALFAALAQRGAAPLETPPLPPGGSGAGDASLNPSPDPEARVIPQHQAPFAAYPRATRCGIPRWA